MSPAQVQTEEQNPLASRQVEVLRLRPGGGRAGRPELQRRCVGPDDRASHPCVCPAAPPAPAGQAAGRVRGELPPGQEASCGVTCSAACPTSSRRSSGTTTRSRGERPELDPRSTSSTTRSRRRSAARRTGLRSRSTRTGSTRTAGGTAPNRRPSGGSKGRIHPPLPAVPRRSPGQAREPPRPDQAGDPDRGGLAHRQVGEGDGGRWSEPGRCPRASSGRCRPMARADGGFPYAPPRTPRRSPSQLRAALRSSTMRAANDPAASGGGRVGARVPGRRMDSGSPRPPHGRGSRRPPGKSSANPGAVVSTPTPTRLSLPVIRSPCCAGCTGAPGARAPSDSTS